MNIAALKELAEKREPLERREVLEIILVIFRGLMDKVSREYDEGGTNKEQMKRITETFKIQETIHLTTDQLKILNQKPNAALEEFWNKLKQLLS